MRSSLRAPLFLPLTARDLGSARGSLRRLPLRTRDRRLSLGSGLASSRRVRRSGNDADSRSLPPGPRLALSPTREPDPDRSSSYDILGGLCGHLLCAGGEHIQELLYARLCVAEEHERVVEVAE